ncbi:MAG: ATP-binding cassette domain-containing protein [Bacilli bacterium]|nr:ATP-binding cassette domain-containing protein [Bacilli bacterium]
MEKVIEVKNVTKDYGNGRGIFDIDLAVFQGEMLGFIGPNGAGKTTTIRAIMGFIKPDKGRITIKGLDAWLESDKIKQYVGYVPGEIGFPDYKSGTDFLKAQAEIKGVKDLSYANYLIERLQLDPSANLKRMSKGMKQKTAIVSSLLANNEILILDEPTTGLDPLMRVSFLDIIKEEKAKGKTIFMSSHVYEDLEKTCDRVALINKGRIVDIVKLDEITNRKVTDFKIEFTKREDYLNFKTLKYRIIRDQEAYNQVTITIEKDRIQTLFNDLKHYNVKFIAEIKYTLERHFNELIRRGGLS